MSFSQLCKYLSNVISPLRLFFVVSISLAAVLLELGVLQLFSVTLAGLFNVNNPLKTETLAQWQVFLGDLDPWLLLIVLAIFSSACKMTAIWCNNSLILDVGRFLSSTIYNNCLRKVPDNKNSFAEKINAALEKIQVLTTSVFIPIFNALTSLLLITAIFSFIAYQSSATFMLSIGLILAVYAGLMFTLRVKLLGNSNVINRYQDRRSNLVLDGLLGIFDIIRYQQQERFSNLFKQNEQDYRRAAHNSLFLGAIPKNFIEALLICMFAVTLLIVGGGADLLESAALLAIGILRALPHFQQVYNGWARFSANRAAIGSILKLLGELDVHAYRTSKHSYTSVTLGAPKALNGIHISDLNVKLGERFFLDSYSTRISLDKPLVIGIRGDSGAGKSVFASIVFGDSELGGDSVHYNFKNAHSKEITHTKAELDISGFLQRYVSICDRNSYLYGESLLYNITFSDDLTAIDYERLQSIWQIVNLSFLGDCTPKLLTSPFRQIASGLSSGQCQRIVLARALYNMKKITLLDEATGMLDQVSEQKIVDAFVESCDVLVIISHRPYLYDLCDVIYSIKNTSDRTEVVSLNKKGSSGQLEHQNGPVSSSF